MPDPDSGEATRRERAVTMQDVADHVGVSKALVSMVFRRVTVLSAQTRQRVLEAAEKLGYRPNRSAALLSLRRSHLIGVMANIRNTFHAELVEGIVAEADGFGYEVVLGAGDADTRRSRGRRHVVGFPVRGARAARSRTCRCHARGADRPRPGGGRRSAGAEPGGRRGADGGRARHRQGGRPSGRAGSSTDQPPQRRQRHHPERPQIGLHARDEEARARRRDLHSRRGLHRARRDTSPFCTKRRWAERRSRPRCALPTTAVRSACSTNCAALASMSPAVSRWRATTTACLPSWPDIDFYHRQPGAAPTGRNGRRQGRRRTTG